MKPQPSLKKSPSKVPAERVVKDIRRATRRHFSAEDKIRIVLDGLRGEDTNRRRGAVADLAPRERLDAMLARLAEDQTYSADYSQFVGGMAFAAGAAIPFFDEAVAAVTRLCALVAD